jgi:hypothetical protein
MSVVVPVGQAPWLLGAVPAADAPVGPSFLDLRGTNRRLFGELLRNTRKTECGAGQFLARLAVRAAPFALLTHVTRGDATELPSPPPLPAN